MDRHAALARLDRHDIWHGFKQLAPLSLFVAVFGLAFGLAATQEGMEDGAIILMSTLVFAGASQFAALDMWGTQVPLMPLVITTFAINARHLLMGATLYPWLHHLPPFRRYGVMVLASDANWAMAIQGFHRGERAFGILFGGGLAIWSFWVAATVVGATAGGVVGDPSSYGLDFALTAVFLAIAVELWEGRSTLAPWGATAVVAVATEALLPGRWYVLCGALAGVLAVVSRRD